MTEKKETLEITTFSGEKLTVDISDKACLEFGFSHKDTIIDPDGNEAIVMGVSLAHIVEALQYRTDEALWYIIKGQKGACHYGFMNLREEGATLKGEEEKKKK